MALQTNTGHTLLIPYLNHLNVTRSISPIMSTTPPGSSNTYHFVPNLIKDLIRTIVVFLQQKHGKGECTNGFSKDNLVVVNDEVKLQGVSYITANPARIVRDYISLRNVLQYNGFLGSSKPIPFDMEHLLIILGNSHGKEDFILRHFALLDSDHRLNFMSQVIQIYDNYMDGKLKGQFRTAVQNVSLPQPWAGHVSVTTRSPLHAVYHYKGGYHHSNFSHFDFLRNSVAHMKGRVNLGKGRVATFSFDEMEHVITAEFPRSVTLLQEQLHGRSLLKYYRLDSSDTPPDI